MLKNQCEQTSLWGFCNYFVKLSFVCLIGKAARTSNKFFHLSTTLQRKVVLSLEKLSSLSLYFIANSNTTNGHTIT